MEAKLTTEHAASSYGVPVLVVDGNAYGAFDKLPNGVVAFFYVKEHAQSLGADAAEKFMRSAPDLYFD